MSNKIIVGSTNPVKVQCALSGFNEMFPAQKFEVEGVNVHSGVSDQPITDEETFRGARNRALNAKTNSPSADFWVGIEGGIDIHNGTMEAFAWIVVISEDRESKARTATFTIPPEIKSLVESGMELGHADDQVFGRDNSKQKNGAVGILSNNVIDRESYYHHAVVLALIPFLNTKLYY